MNEWIIESLLGQRCKFRSFLVEWRNFFDGRSVYVISTHKHTHTPSQSLRMTLILFNCLIDTIYFTVSAFHLPFASFHLPRIRFSYWLTQSFRRHLNIHRYETKHTFPEELLTWMEKVIFRFSISQGPLFLPCCSSRICLCRKAQAAKNVCNKSFSAKANICTKFQKDS